MEKIELDGPKSEIDKLKKEGTYDTNGTIYFCLDDKFISVRRWIIINYNIINFYIYIL